jgi:hypothetical protein
MLQFKGSTRWMIRGISKRSRDVIPYLFQNLNLAARMNICYDAFGQMFGGCVRVIADQVGQYSLQQPSYATS